MALPLTMTAFWATAFAEKKTKKLMVKRGCNFNIVGDYLISGLNDQVSMVVSVNQTEEPDSPGAMALIVKAWISVGMCRFKAT